MYKPSPRWRRKDTIEERTPKKGPDHSRTRTTPQRGHPVPPKGIHQEAPHETTRSRARPTDGVKLGIDFWHAVEFSRIRRAPPQAFRLSVGATLLTYPSRSRPVNFAPGLAVEGFRLRAATRASTVAGLGSPLDRPQVLQPPCAPCARLL